MVNFMKTTISNLIVTKRTMNGWKLLRQVEREAGTCPIEGLRKEFAIEQCHLDFQAERAKANYNAWLVISVVALAAFWPVVVL